MDGREGNLSRDSLEALWNADELVEIRSAMARGEKPAACSRCWKREAKGGVSRRILLNPAYRHVGGELAVDKLADEGAATGYRLERRPDWFIFELGNVCNLKCRSCNPLSSSRVAADRVQVAWTGEMPAIASNGAAWFKQIDKLAAMVAEGGHQNAMLSLIGGEPFLIPQTWQLLEELVARGIAPHVFLGLLTNGMQRSAKIEQLAPHFRGFSVSVSIDGYGRLNDYLRHGSKWSTLAANLDWLRGIPNVSVGVTPTLQNGNALDMPALLRFIDERDLVLSYNVLTDPPRLRPANLPPSVRRIAARRLRTFVDTECKPVNRDVVRAYCEQLDEAPDDFDPDLFHEFATFTNDLDASRGESLADAAPELVALIRAAGVKWPHDRRHVAPPPAQSSFDPGDLERRVNRTVSPHDVIFALGEDVQANWYFRSGTEQIAEIDARLREHDHAGLAGSRAVADYASHYGRMTRVLRTALPHAAVYACDIDPAAVAFCAGELGALPVLTGWRPDEETLPCDLDAIVCISLLTHTSLEHWRRTLSAWAAMLRPGGAVAFTFLSDEYIPRWLAGEMEAYGTYRPDVRAAVASAVRDEGFGFAPRDVPYGDEAWYGVTFATAAVVRREIEAAGLEVLAMPGDAASRFGQELAIARKPGGENAAVPQRPAVQRDVRVMALYDPRCYAPAKPAEGDHAQSIWARLTASDRPVPLPTELGFGDPRVPEVRESQAALAREHGIDAFCFVYACNEDGALWDAAFRDLVASGRPDLPFSVMIASERGVRIDTKTGVALFEGLVEALRDRRYVRVDGRPLIVVRDLATLSDAREIIAAWRRAAAERGIGELHVCAVRPRDPSSPQDDGVDSFLEAPESVPDRTAATAASLLVTWPPYRFFRSVTVHRNAADPRADELYELRLHAAIDATRRHGESLVFVDAWNDWLRGRYLEPDDRDGRAALLATRRATRGPASGLVLLRRLRDTLGDVDPSTNAVLGELEHVVSQHERARDRLLATVEAELERDRPPIEMPLRGVPVPSRQLYPSGAHATLDHVAGTDGVALAAGEPIVVRGDELLLMGWAHIDAYAPDAVDVFIALEALDDGNDRVFRASGRVARPDVAAAYPGFPANCGFELTAGVRGLAPGRYRVAIVQRTPDVTYRDVTSVILEREESSCSST